MNEQIRILCVDDEKNVLKALQRLFLDCDYEILTAPSGTEGLEILRNTEDVQIIISDYRMPGMNGVDFLKKAYEHQPDTVRMVLSGFADTSAIVSAINEGKIYKFIPKPWNDDDLKVTVSNALDHYFIHKKNLELTIELEKNNKELIEMNDNLEKIVKKRTAELVTHNEALRCSQNILDSLPVGVIGIDPEGQIVQCNNKAQHLLGSRDKYLIGSGSHIALPEDMNNFISELKDTIPIEKQITLSNIEIRVKGVYMKHPGGQEGTILVLEEVNRDV